HFLVPPGADASDGAAREIERADVVASLDIGDLSRLGSLAAVISKRQPPFVCIDHHVSPVKLPAGPSLIAPDATATAELVFDLATVADWPVTAEVAQALYVGLLTDTGGFRFSNTTARAVRVAALAHQFGGGGHHRAAGASLPGTMADVEAKVLNAARRFLTNGGGGEST